MCFCECVCVCVCERERTSDISSKGKLKLRWTSVVLFPALKQRAANIKSPLSSSTFGWCHNGVCFTLPVSRTHTTGRRRKLEIHQQLTAKAFGPQLVLNTNCTTLSITEEVIYRSQTEYKSIIIKSCTVRYCTWGKQTRRPLVVRWIILWTERGSYRKPDKSSLPCFNLAMVSIIINISSG